MRRYLIIGILPACVIGAGVVILLLRSSTGPRDASEEPIPEARAKQSAEVPSETNAVWQARRELPTGPRGILLDPSKDETTRNNAARELLRRGDPRLVDDLTRMLWDEKETPKWRNYCVQHLSYSYEKKPDPAILEKLFKAAECEEKQVKMCAIWSLARVVTQRFRKGNVDEETLARIRELALAALRDENAHFLIREAGVQSCARLGLTKALPKIRKIAHDDATKPRHLRIAAVAALGELKDAESVAFLEKLFKASKGQLRAAAELALRRIREAQKAEAPEPSETTPPGQF